MSEKFVIDRKRLNQLVEEYGIEKRQARSKNDEKKIKEKYVELVINTLGTSALREAIDEEPLKDAVYRILTNKKIHESYSNEESLNMIEGLSNYEIVGDWQCFWTVKSEYLFKLPKSMQEIFAENFAIGNEAAKVCLLKLWEKHIMTRAIDVARKSEPDSNNYIVIQCNKEDMSVMFETLRQKNTGKRCVYVTMY